MSIFDDYRKYLFNCHMQGDIWNQDYRPYTYIEWLFNNKPENGGIKL